MRWSQKHLIFQKETLRPREVDVLPTPTQLVIKSANLEHKPLNSESNTLSTKLSNILPSYPLVNSTEGGNHRKIKDMLLQPLGTKLNIFSMVLKT